MAYSDSFPATRPVFQADFANGGRVDPRITFSRSDTPPTYAAPSAVHYWSDEKHISSENLFLQSSDFDTSWFPNGINGTPTGGQADPAGGTDGFTVVEDSAVGAIHRIFQAANASGDLAFTVYAKQNSGTRYLTLTLFNANNNWTAATFDLAGGSPATGSGSSSVFTSVSATQTASGNGYYKCTLKATGALAGTAYIYLGSSTAAPAGTYGSVPYTGDGTSSLDIAFASLTTTGASDYQPTTTQIHREYAPTLKSVSTAGQPRFEYSPTDSASEAIGQSRGLLIEGQSTNLLAESTDFSGSWQIVNATKSLEAIAPNGALNAIAFREGTNSLEKRLLRYYTGGGGSVTISIYAKLLGNARRLVIREANASAQYATFDLVTGTKVSGLGSIESVGNGWWRCQLNLSTTGTVQAAGFYIVPADGNYGNREYAGDGYSGLLLAHPQAEDQSWASSWISTTSSAVTRASDSASTSVSNLGLTSGQDLTLVVEGTTADANGAALIGLDDGSSTNFARILRSPSNLNYTFDVRNNAAYEVNQSVSGSSGSSKFALRLAQNDVGFSHNGSAAVTDTNAVLPLTSTLRIGYAWWGVEAGGTISRVAVYSEPLSDTNLQALTK